MSAKRLAFLVVQVLALVLVVICSAVAQVNEASITAGRAFVSTQTIQNPVYVSDPNIRFGREEMIEFNYGHFFARHKIFGLYGEVPVAIYPRMDLNTYENHVPKDIGALFITPSARVNLFSGDSVTPWVSVGGGYGRFRQAPTLLWGGKNPGPTGTNTGVLQFGGGLDVWFWNRWGGRLEVRDFYSGVPTLNVQTNVSRQHNYYVGVGVVHRF